MKKICVIFTGGTIGSSVKDGYVDINSKSSSVLINGFYQKTKSEIEFDEVHPINILSENITKDDSCSLIKEVESAVKSDKYCGVIITHGTDTLCFSANLLSQVFCDADIPILFVSALYPLDDKRTNGFDNFISAVEFIKRGYKGVFVVNRNIGECTKFFRASMMIEPEQISGRMISFGNCVFGEFDGGEFKLIEENVDDRTDNAVLCKELFSKNGLCTDILIVESRALIDYKYYEFNEDNKPKAVIIKLYHSGTMCTVGERENALRYIDYCKEAGVQVILGPVDKSANVYASMSSIQNSCVLAYGLSFEMIVARTMVALGANADLDTLRKALNEF